MNTCCVEPLQQGLRACLVAGTVDEVIEYVLCVCTTKQPDPYPFEFLAHCRLDRLLGVGIRPLSIDKSRLAHFFPLGGNTADNFPIWLPRTPGSQRRIGYAFSGRSSFPFCFFRTPHLLSMHLANSSSGKVVREVRHTRFKGLGLTFALASNSGAAVNEGGQERHAPTKGRQDGPTVHVQRR